MKTESKVLNWKTFGAIFCFHTLFSLSFAPRIFFSENPWLEINSLLYFALANYMWVALTLLVFRLGEMFPVAFPFNLKNLLLHFLFGLTIVGISTVSYVTVTNFIRYGEFSLTAGKVPAVFIINTVTQGILYYTGSIAVHQALFYSNKFRERESQLQQAELQILRMQIHPHFFFNTLNAISALMYRSPKEADRMIIQLGDMFRIALKKDKTQEVLLKEELDFLKAFLQIHQTLMGKRLRTEWNIEPDTLEASVPNLILQPLAENAIQHGIAPLEAGGQITISAERQKGHLLLQISDNGQGFVSQDASKTGGIGLSNTKARLENLYGDQQNFSIYETPDGGVSVQIKIPFRERSGDDL